MDGLIQPGDTLRMERAGAPLATEKRIGEGGQGVVHVARLNGTPFAVKWFRPGLGSDGMRTSITALIQRGRPPHPAFVWPIDLVSSDHLPGSRRIGVAESLPGGPDERRRQRGHGLADRLQAGPGGDDPDDGLV